MDGGGYGSGGVAWVPQSVTGGVCRADVSHLGGVPTHRTGHWRRVSAGCGRRRHVGQVYTVRGGRTARGARARSRALVLTPRCPGKGVPHAATDGQTPRRAPPPSAWRAEGVWCGFRAPSVGVVGRAGSPHAFLAWQPPPSRQPPLAPGSRCQGVGMWPRPRPLLSLPVCTPSSGAGSAQSVLKLVLLSFSGGADRPQYQFPARRNSPSRHARVGAAQRRRLGGEGRQGPFALLNAHKQSMTIRRQARARKPGCLRRASSFMGALEKTQ